MNKIRIAKFLSDRGIASRRAAEQMLVDGRVIVDGIKINSPVFFVDGSEEIKIDGKKISGNESEIKERLYAFYKPVGTMTTTSDPEGRKTIYDVLPPQYKNLKYIGRLDFNTSGLLLLTNSGEISRKMTLPSSGLERVYIATVGRAWTIDDEHMNRLLKPLRRGAKIDGIIYKPMKIERLSASDLKVTISEGKKNEIRIAFESIGLPVRKLHRISYGDIELGELKPGEIKEIILKNKNHKS